MEQILEHTNKLHQGPTLQVTLEGREREGGAKEAQLIKTRKKETKPSLNA